MSSFSCISKTKFQLPNSILNKIQGLDPVSFDRNDKLARNPIYRQLNKLVVSGIPIKIKIKITDPDTKQTVEIDPPTLNKLRERYLVLKEQWNTGYSPFKEQELPASMQKEVIDYLPSSLQKLKPHVAIQSKMAIDGIVAPHRDHYRTASLFLLLEGNEEQTVWWNKTDDFEEFDYFRFADVTKISKIHTEIIEKNTWYVFDNYTYHSVHPGTQVGRRTALCIEFNTLSADELYKEINDIREM